MESWHPRLRDLEHERMIQFVATVGEPGAESDDLPAVDDPHGGRVIGSFEPGKRLAGDLERPLDLYLRGSSSRYAAALTPSRRGPMASQLVRMSISS